jgi:CcmD family protein
MSKIKHFTSTVWLLLLFLSAQAQDAVMADTFRSEGKIYVVIGVIVLIFAVLFAYLVYLDVRLKRLEKENKKG